MTFNDPGYLVVTGIAKITLVAFVVWLVGKGLRSLKRVKVASDAKAVDAFAEAMKGQGKMAPTQVAVDQPVEVRAQARQLKPAETSSTTGRAQRHVASPKRGVTSKLSAEELDFLRSQRIPVSELFDATGLKKGQYAEAMNQTGQKFAYGTKRCAKGGHALRTRKGHCIQCNTSAIAFERRHSRPGHVYIAWSASTQLTKVGTTIDLADRANKLREHGYGGARDWEIVLSAYVANAGSVEFAAQDNLREFSVEGSYVREGRVQACYELFRCSYDQAREAVVSTLPLGSAIRAADERRARRMWSGGAPPPGKR